LTNDFAQKNDNLFKGLDDLNKSLGLLQKTSPASPRTARKEKHSFSITPHSRRAQKLSSPKTSEAELAPHQHTEEG
jgi:hypothetical protein